VNGQNGRSRSNLTERAMNITATEVKNRLVEEHGVFGEQHRPW